jgi:hypothetical protein
LTRQRDVIQPPPKQLSCETHCRRSRSNDSLHGAVHDESCLSEFYSTSRRNTFDWRKFVTLLWRNHPLHGSDPTITILSQHVFNDGFHHFVFGECYCLC